MTMNKLLLNTLAWTFPTPRPSSQGALTPSGPITQPLGQRRPLSVHLVRPGQAERARLAQYFLAHHYLGYPHPLGQLHCLVTDSQGRDLAVLLFGPAAWKCAPRDLFIGWSAAQRQAHLKQVANNSRYLALHGRRLSRRQLDRVGPDHRTHPPRPHPSAPDASQGGVGLSTGPPVSPPPMRLSRRQQLFQLARNGLGKLIELLLRLEAKLRRLLGKVSALRRQVKELKARLALNSTNSSKPPSSDGLAKPAPKSLRTRTGRRPGGQPGHPGQTLQPVVRPDHEIVHRLERCTCGACHGCSLREAPVLGHEKRQVFELPQKPLEVTEHQAEIKRCPVSGALVTAAFPPQVNAPAQYGPRFRAQMVYFHEDHFIPYTRSGSCCPRPRLITAMRAACEWPARSIGCTS